MIRILKLGDTIYENFEPKQLIPIFDEKGNVIDYQEVWAIPTDINTLKQAVIDTLIWLTKRRINETLQKYHYYSIGDVLIYAREGEAQKLLDWYREYDTKVWQWIENFNQNFNPSSLDEMLAIDLKQVEENIFKETETLLP